jgi:hypothetical protein
MCNFRATSALHIPCPQFSTIRARKAMDCADFGRREIMLNFSRSASMISRGFFGRPVRIPEYEAANRIRKGIYRQDTSVLSEKYV